MKFIRDKKIMSVLLQEVKYLTGIIGGFNLAALAIMAGKDLNFWGEVSLFFIAMSTLLLILSTYLIAFLSGINELLDHPEVTSGELRHNIEAIDKNSFFSISLIWCFGVCTFVFGIFTLCINIGFGAVFGFVFALLAIHILFKYSREIYNFLM